ncbi:NAD(P)-binding protein [Scenedesmus sp. NREL 46B-D3]|nr:NAD(P)-binding protein [Scenedesmus sp. NREL 46B-D3]
MAEGAHVVMACRNMEACSLTQQELQQRQLPGTCQCCRLDLADLESVRSFAKQQQEELQSSKQPLQVLVNNAGVMGLGPGPDGSNQHLTINHYGPFLLTNLLLPCMEPGSRIVNVASRAHLWGRLQVKDGGVVPGWSNWFPEYAQSKLCNVLFTAELQRRLQGQGILATSVSPGFVNTTIFRSLPSWLGRLATAAAPSIARTPAEGAQVAVYAATSPSLDTQQPAPLFLHDCKPMPPAKLAEDRQLAADLWEASAAAVGWKE